MTDPYVELSVSHNTLVELEPFKDKKTAQEFQEKNPTTGSTLLIPYYENEQIKLLLPGSIDSSNLSEDLNANLRIIGAKNPSKRKKLLVRIKHFFYQKLGIHYVRHISDLVGDSINLDENNFIIIYNQTKYNDNDSSFEKFIENENQENSKQFKEKLFCGKPLINDAEFLENLSKLAANLKLEEVKTYFIFRKEDASLKILCENFNGDDAILNVLKKHGLAKSAELKPDKYKNYHILGFLRDWIKWTVFAAVTGVGTGLILGLFVTPPLGTILAALAAVITFVGISSLGFSKATKNNQTTIEFGTSELIDEQQISFVSRMKNNLHNFFIGKSNKLVTLPTENTKSEIFTTMMGAPNESNSVSNLNPTCASLVKLSLPLSLLFKFRRENDSSITEDNHLHSTHTILKK